MSATMRDRFGIDPSRSWGVRFLRRATLPAFFALAVAAWLVTALTTVAIDERAILERFGRPTAVLRPGLRVHLPWPLDRVRRVAWQRPRVVALSVEPTAPRAAEPADAEPDPSWDRLWDRVHPDDALYVIPGGARGDAGSALELVSSDIRVVFRPADGDDGLIRWTYAANDLDALVRASAMRLVARRFAAAPLDQALGEDRDAAAERLRTDLQADLDGLGAGVEVRAVVIDAIHPPLRAATAYHGVQAAGIAAEAEVARARTQAVRERAQAVVDTTASTAEADAGAVEAMAQARTESVRFDASEEAWRRGGEAFVLERRLAALTALHRVPIVIIDHRLATTASTIDLRSEGMRGSQSFP